MDRSQHIGHSRLAQLQSNPAYPAVRHLRSLARFAAATDLYTCTKKTADAGNVPLGGTRLAP